MRSPQPAWLATCCLLATATLAGCHSSGGHGWHDSCAPCCGPMTIEIVDDGHGHGTACSCECIAPQHGYAPQYVERGYGQPPAMCDAGGRIQRLPARAHGGILPEDEWRTVNDDTPPGSFTPEASPVGPNCEIPPVWPYPKGQPAERTPTVGEGFTPPRLRSH